MNKLILPMQTVEVNSTAIQKADYEYDNYETDGTDDYNVEIEDDIEGMISAVLDEMNEE